MNIIQEKNKITIHDIKDFDANHIFECGQCFRWNKEEDGSYTGMVKKDVYKRQPLPWPGLKQIGLWA